MINSIRHPFTVYYKDETHSLGDREKKIIAAVTIAAAFTIVLFPFAFLLSSAYFRHTTLKEMRRQEETIDALQQEQNTHFLPVVPNEPGSELWTLGGDLHGFKNQFPKFEERLLSYLNNSDTLTFGHGVLFPGCEFLFENSAQTIKVFILKSRLSDKTEQFKTALLNCLNNSQENSLKDLKVKFEEKTTLEGQNIIEITFSKQDNDEEVFT